MSGALPSLAVVIPTFGRAASLRECLGALAAQTDTDFEVVVVCDGPDPKTVELAEAGHVRLRITWVHLPENLGPSNARNVGARTAASDVLFFLDDDMSAAPQCIAEHKRFHAAKDEGRWVAMGNTAEHFAAPASSFVEEALRRERFPHAADRGRLVREMEKLVAAMTVFCGNDCSIRRDEYLAAGGADVHLRMGEDLELGGRLSLAGFRFAILPHAEAVHRNEKNLQEQYPIECERTARAEVYRVRHKGQRLPQVRNLALICEGGAGQRMKAFTAREMPRLAQWATRLALDGANRFRSPALFRLWKGLLPSIAYAGALRQEDIATEDLRSLVGSPVAVIGLHSISTMESAADAQHGMSPATFARLISRLERNGYSFASCDDLLRANPRRTACLTFDDGYEDFLKNAAPVLIERRIPATVFVVAGLIGKTNEWDVRAGRRGHRLLDASQLRELHEMGIGIGCHSMTHADLTKVDRIALHTEVVDAKQRLEDLIGAEVGAFAYPSGFHNDAVRAKVAEAGFRVAFTAQPGLDLWGDPLAMRRVGMSERDTLIDFMLKMRSGRSRWQEWRQAARSKAYPVARLLAR